MSLTTALAIAARAALTAPGRPFAVDRSDVRRIVTRIRKLPLGCVRPRDLRDAFPPALARAMVTGDFSAVPARLRQHLRPDGEERVHADILFAAVWATAPTLRLVVKTTGLDPDAALHRAARLRKAGWHLARRPGRAVDADRDPV